jgi:hypothetical protein
MIDRGNEENRRISLTYEKDFTGFGNARIVPELNEALSWSRFRRYSAVTG